jgi:hypothetical protein
MAAVAAQTANPGADASVLYNAGTEALSRGDLGPAVAFFAAADRLEPRASDIRLNLGLARARVVEQRGEAVAHAGASRLSALALSPAESWWLAALLLTVGAVAGCVRIWRPGRRVWTVAGVTLFASGALFMGACFLRAREEARTPAAVVVVPVLRVGPAPEERPRPPYLLGAGEEVRLGVERGASVEILVSGNPIGWAPRAGVWRVGDAARYTASFAPR